MRMSPLGQTADIFRVARGRTCVKAKLPWSFERRSERRLCPAPRQINRRPRSMRAGPGNKAGRQNALHAGHGGETISRCTRRGIVSSEDQFGAGEQEAAESFQRKSCNDSSLLVSFLACLLSHIQIFGRGVLNQKAVELIRDELAANESAPERASAESKSLRRNHNQKRFSFSSCD